MKPIEKKNTCFIVLACIMSMLIMPAATFAGGIKVYEKDGKYVKLGGRMQLQYHNVDPDDPDAESTDTLFFRRLRPYVEGSLHKDWKGKFQFDYGKAEDDNEVSIKDAYFQYKGIDNVKVTIGNANFPFSRELLTSSKKQQLVERTFVGDHNYGTPDRNTGLHLTGTQMDKKLEWGLSAAVAVLDPDDDKLDFDTPVNSKSDFNQGWMLGGRVDFHPMGYVKKSQGDLKGGSDFKATVGIGAYAWNNDDDNNTRTTAGAATDTSKPDVESVNGFEISGAVRGQGLSVDAQYNIFNAETIDSTVTSGVYKNGETDLKNFAVEGGYMVVPATLEVVGGYQVQDADGYAENWTRTSDGANWYLKKHDIKMQLSYRMGENLKGVEDSDENEMFLQAQYVF